VHAEGLEVRHAKGPSSDRAIIEIQKREGERIAIHCSGNLVTFFRNFDQGGQLVQL